MATGPATQVSSTILSAVQQFQTDLQTEEVSPLQTQVTAINAQISALGTMKNNLQTLYNTSTAMAVTNRSSTFLTLIATSSMPNIVSATATATAASGNHSILVTQLAKTDVALSNQLNSSSGSIVTAEGTGVKTIQVGNQTVNVTLSSGDSNSTVLTNIANAVNAMKGNVTASVVTDTSSTSRLVFQSTQTGSANAITLSDTAGTLLSNLGLSSAVISARTAFNSTTAGFMNQSTSALDANFKLDGIDMVRSSNTVTDALTGVTLGLAGLQSPTDTPATINVGINTNQIQTMVQQFITNYNAALSYVNNETAMISGASTTGSTATVTPQIFAGNPTFTMLKVNLQSVIWNQVTSAKPGNPENLFQIGITPGADGTLSISDTSKFNAAMAADPTEITDLFNSSNGVAVQMNNLLKPFVTPTTGRIDSMNNVDTSEVSSLNDRIKTLNAQIANQTTQYQNELVQLQAEYEDMLATQNEMASILTGSLYPDTTTGTTTSTSSTSTTG
ncbi:MAG TPA: flagellar filament capping protein FliD [Bacteroidota bacterium]|nr:flagellar filament capping protein FliD [Bacteroidota bacterium]